MWYTAAFPFSPSVLFFHSRWLSFLPSTCRVLFPFLCWTWKGYFPLSLKMWDSYEDFPMSEDQSLFRVHLAVFSDPLACTDDPCQLWNKARTYNWSWWEWRINNGCFRERICHPTGCWSSPSQWVPMRVICEAELLKYLFMTILVLSLYLMNSSLRGRWLSCGALHLVLLALDCRQDGSWSQAG